MSTPKKYTSEELKIMKFSKWYARYLKRQGHSRCLEYVRGCVECDFFRLQDELTNVVFILK